MILYCCKVEYTQLMDKINKKVKQCDALTKIFDLKKKQAFRQIKSIPKPQVNMVFDSVGVYQ